MAEECRSARRRTTRPAGLHDYDQVELDASYDNGVYEPLIASLKAPRLQQRGRARPYRRAPASPYGPTEIEKLCLSHQPRQRANLRLHPWGNCCQAQQDSGYPAEMFVNAGAHYVALDFKSVKEARRPQRDRRKYARHRLVYKNAASSRRSRPSLHRRLFLRGHLCGVALVTDWQSSSVSRQHGEGGFA